MSKDKLFVPRILFIDIETSPNIVLSWSVGRKINLDYNNIVKERSIICACWKWGGESKIYSCTWGRKQNEIGMLRRLQKLLNSADLIVGHNSDKFDLRFIFGKLAQHKLPALENLPTEDTLKLSKKAFYLNSYRLDYLGKFFNLGQKNEMTFNLWKQILLKNDRRALHKMIQYCKQDVHLTERVFDRISAYVKPRFNKSRLWTSKKFGCDVCGKGIIFAKSHGIRGKKSRWVCPCGRYYSVPISILHEKY